MKRLSASLSAIACVALGAQAFAVPTMQVGAPGSGGEGTYANYQTSLTAPNESDTAIGAGNTIYVAAAYSNKTLAIGGKYGSGPDWSSFGIPAIFNGRGAILLASVPNGSIGTLTIDLGGGPVSPFHTSTTNSYWPNNHDPVKDAISDFLFFDIGSFGNGGTVPDFASETGSATGQIKTITFSNVGYDWVHFDAMALETKTQGRGVSTSLQNNPGSHDMTTHFEDPKDPECPDDSNEPEGVPTPEPVTAGLGLMGLGAPVMRVTRRRR